MLLQLLLILHLLELLAVHIFTNDHQVRQGGALRYLGDDPATFLGDDGYSPDACQLLMVRVSLTQVGWVDIHLLHLLIAIVNITSRNFESQLFDLFQVLVYLVLHGVLDLEASIINPTVNQR